MPRSLALLLLAPFLLAGATLGCLGPPPTAPAAKTPGPPRAADPDEDADALPPVDAPPRRIGGRRVQVTFEGNAAIPSAELLRRIWVDKDATPSFSPRERGETWAQAQQIFARDILILQAAYFDRGHVLIRFGEPKVEERDGLIAIVLPIEHEGPRMRVRSVKLVEKGPDGTDREVSVAGAARALTLKPGAFASRRVLVRDMKIVKELYAAEGYVDVEDDTDMVVDEPRAEVDLVAIVKPGRRRTPAP